ncbi:hypothetical protein QFZ20_003747 [Flavobacterium sp. W4I14]|nr:hypothetical protein [Flavobacterium sp. W4I14]
MPKQDISLIPTEIILNKIFLLREEKVMLDFQLAEFIILKIEL